MFLESLDFARCSSFFPPFLVENAAKQKKSMKKTKKIVRKIEMMKNEKKINEKMNSKQNIKHKWHRLKKGSPEKPDELKSQKCKKNSSLAMYSSFVY